MNGVPELCLIPAPGKLLILGQVCLFIYRITAKILSSFKTLRFLSLCFISKPVRHVETNLFFSDSMTVQTIASYGHSIANIKPAGPKWLWTCVSHQLIHFWITCYKPIFIYFFSNFSSLGKFMLVPGICRHTPWRPASKKFICFSQPTPTINKLFSFALKGVSVSSIYSLCFPYKNGLPLVQFPFQTLSVFVILQPTSTSRAQ